MKKLNQALTVAMFLTLAVGVSAYAHSEGGPEGEETGEMEDCATGIDVSAKRNSGKAGDPIGSSKATKAVKKGTNRSGSANDQAPVAD